MKKILTCLLASCLLVPNLAAAFYRDVHPTDQYYDSIKALTDSGVIGGYPDGNFIAKNRINRAEFTKIVLGAMRNMFPSDYPTDSELEELVPNTGCLPDVRKSDWFAKYVCYAKSQNFIDGYPDGTFAPSENINVVEAMKIVFEMRDPYGVAAYEEEGSIWYQKYTSYADNINAWVESWKTEGSAYRITRGEMTEFVEKAIFIQ